MRRVRSVGTNAFWIAVLLVAVLGAPGEATGQDLADLDYEHLEFRGVGFEVGYLFPTRVENTPTYSVRFDMGYLGPGLRIVPSFTYWSSPFRVSEVTTLEERVESLVRRATGNPPPQVDLGVIEWTNYSLGLDSHVVWALPLNLLSFAGLGVSAHILDGSGAAIDGTFIEDLLDSVTAGFNLHLGLEYPVTDRMRIQGQGRYSVMEDMQYFHLGLGGQILWGTLVPGEERR
ncbi:MAG: hypothetical protein WD995_11860 [Gemmatimonadota bacterium]